MVETPKEGSEPQPTRRIRRRPFFSSPVPGARVHDWGAILDALSEETREHLLGNQKVPDGEVSDEGAVNSVGSGGEDNLPRSHESSIQPSKDPQD